MAAASSLAFRCSQRVEERQQVAVADVEEEVVGAPLVPVLEQIGERNLQHVLVEADRPLDI
jgi:hypothetical protein